MIFLNDQRTYQWYYFDKELKTIGDRNYKFKI